MGGDALRLAAALEPRLAVQRARRRRAVAGRLDAKRCRAIVVSTYELL